MNLSSSQHIKSSLTQPLPFPLFLAHTRKHKSPFHCFTFHSQEQSYNTIIPTYMYILLLIRFMLNSTHTVLFWCSFSLFYATFSLSPVPSLAPKSSLNDPISLHVVVNLIFEREKSFCYEIVSVTHVLRGKKPKCPKERERANGRKRKPGIVEYSLIRYWENNIWREDWTTERVREVRKDG